MSREKILAKLRAAKQPFPDAPPRPKDYLPVTRLDDDSPGALLERFTAELERLNGVVYTVADEAAACEKVLAVVEELKASSVLTWDIEYIPIKGLEAALKKADVSRIVPDIHEAYEMLPSLAEVPLGLTGADAAFATTGTLVVSTGPGKGRIPTVLPPVHLVVIRQSQILPRIENWVAGQKESGMASIVDRANLCFISGPSRTADIEKQLVLGMHGPEQLQVIVIADQ